MLLKPFPIVFVLLAAARCGHRPASLVAPPAGATFRAAAAKPVAPLPAAAPSIASAPRAPGDDGAMDDLWRRADEGDADDLARLADREGAAGLVERVKSGRSKLTALRALAYADGYAALPFLAAGVAGPSDAEASAAVESLADIAARPRRAVDQEDGFELREGCDAIAALARDTSKPRARRIGAVRFLRMMVDRGCVQAEAIPTDLDAR